MNQIIWIDVRDDKTSNSTHMSATANGKTADVRLALRRSGWIGRSRWDGNLLSQTQLLRAFAQPCLKSAVAV